MLSGMYLGGARGDVASAEQWLGAELQMSTMFVEKSDWTSWKWAVGANATAASEQGVTPLISLPLITDDSTLQEAAAHAYDANYVYAAQKLVAELGTDTPIVIRLGNEMNADYFSWSAIEDPAAFAQAFRNAVDAFRSVSGNFKFEWNIAVGKAAMDPASAYPGDAHVDYIGGDFYYAKADGSTADAAKMFQYLVGAKYGLQWLENFAAAHGKQTAYSEWGINSANGGPFVALAKQWFDTHNVAYANYWESNEAFRGMLQDGQHGAAGDVYKAMFGTGIDPAEANVASSWTGGSANDYFGQEAVNIDYTIDAAGGHDTIALAHGDNVVSGGSGNDNIYVGNGDNIIYGNVAGATTDSADTIMAGGGNNRIEGQQGSDRITAGIDDSTGNNSIDGGDGNDVILLRGSGANSVLGGAGNDRIDAGAARGANLLDGGLGDDTLLGGAGRDTLVGGAGYNMLVGNDGSDRLVVGTTSGHVDVMTGGAGADIFDFSQLGSAAVAVSETTAAYQEITDFQAGIDDIDLSFGLKAGDLLIVSLKFSTVASAQAHAQKLLSGHAGTTDVAAVRVGTDTFLFYHDGGTAGAIDAVVKLDGISNKVLGMQDFI